MAKKITLINQFSLFSPKTEKGLFFDYPELRNVEEFKRLSKRDMLFVWYFACEASPLCDVKNDTDRALSAVTHVEKLHGSFSSVAKKQLLTLNFNAQIDTAVKRIAEYRIGTRVRAKMMVEKVMSNYENIISIDINSREFFDTENGDRDFDKVKKYVDASSTIMKNLPELIKQAENGFSVIEKGKEGIDEEADSFMDEYHEHTN